MNGLTTRNKIDFRELDQVLDLFDSYGIKVVLDLHNYNDMAGFFGSEEWIASWVEMANRYKNDDRIVIEHLLTFFNLCRIYTYCINNSFKQTFNT